MISLMMKAMKRLFVWADKTEIGSVVVIII